MYYYNHRISKCGSQTGHGYIIHVCRLLVKHRSRTSLANFNMVYIAISCIATVYCQEIHTTGMAKMCIYDIIIIVISLAVFPCRLEVVLPITLCLQPGQCQGCNFHTQTTANCKSSDISLIAFRQYSTHKHHVAIFKSSA